MLFFFTLLLSSLYGAAALNVVDISKTTAGVRLRKASWRAAAVDASVPQGGIRMGDVQDSVYVADLTVGTQVLQVVLDTGSSGAWLGAIEPGARASFILPFSDLWIDPAQGIEALGGAILGNGDQLRLGYASGGVVGKAAVAPVSLGSYTVPQQLLLSANWTYELDALSSHNIRGIMGLSFDSAATLPRLLDAPDRRPTFLANVFAQHPAAGNFTTFYMCRGDVEGFMTINEIPEQFSEGMKSVPPINAWRNPDTKALQRWTVAVANLEVGGQTVGLTSQVTGAPANTALAVLDTGSTLTYLPNDTITAMYSGIPGATYAAKANVWLMPCEAEVSVAFHIGGLRYVMNPLDLIVPYSVPIDGSEAIVCAGAFRATTPDLRKLLAADMWLGDSFLRNVFQVLHYGDSTTDKQRPLVQLLGITDEQEAAAQYTVERANLRKYYPREANLTDPIVLAAVIHSFPTPAESESGTNLTSSDATSTSASSTLSPSPHSFPSQRPSDTSGTLPRQTLACGLALATLFVTLFSL
ncbi:acid protease [Auricularia subglabra TFB-10046 SS5]|uniref:Acid protease n=1 Tax=Auricularia subglabra (strain TFB-10046 / SS5) TaxID=717982 RepID=J0LFF0_AURST|nr:acid protease [Auricularia subglabra TFB-10046 SS5]